MLNSMDEKNENIYEKIDNLYIPEIELVLKKWFFTHRADYKNHLEQLLHISPIQTESGLRKILWEMMKALVLKRVNEHINQTDSLRSLSRFLDDSALQALFISCNYLNTHENHTIDMFQYRDILALFNRFHGTIKNRVSRELSSIVYLFCRIDEDIQSPEDFDSLEAALKILSLLSDERNIHIIEMIQLKTTAGESFSPWDLKDIFFNPQGEPTPEFNTINQEYLQPLQNLYITGASAVSQAAQKRIDESFQLCEEIEKFIYYLPLSYTPLIKNISSPHGNTDEAIQILLSDPLWNTETNVSLVTAHLEIVRKAAALYVDISDTIQNFKKIYKSLWLGESHFFKRKSFFNSICEQNNIESINLIRRKAEQFPESRTAAAWNITMKYHHLNNGDLSEDMDLFLDVYKESFARSFALSISKITGRFEFFSKKILTLNQDDIQLEHLEEPSSRSAKVLSELRKPSRY